MSLTALVFVGVYAAGLVMALVRDPRYGLYAYLWAFYLHPPSRWWGDTLPDIRWSLVAAVVALIATAIHRDTTPREPWHANAAVRLLMLYAVWMWVQFLWLDDFDRQLEGAILITKYVFLYIVVNRTLRTEEDLRRFALAHVAGCLYFGWLGFSMSVEGRLEGVGGPGVDDANTLGMHLSTGLVFAALLLLGTTGYTRWFAFAAIPFILNGVVLTNSRGAFLGVLAAGLAAFVLKPRAYRVWFYVLAILGLGLFLRLAHEEFWARMGTITAVTQDPEAADASTETRLALFSAQWRMFTDHPLGSGFNGTAALSPQYLSEQHLTVGDDGVTMARASHNTVMSTLVDQGFVGTLLYLGMVLYAWRALRRLRKLDAQGLPASLGTYRAAAGGALMAVFAAGMFASYLKAEVQIWCLAMVPALLEIAQRTLAAGEADKRPSARSTPVQSWVAQRKQSAGGPAS
jgi:O-antigen ligase